MGEGEALEGRLYKVGQMITAALEDQLNFDSLLDSFLVLFNECSTKDLQKDKNIANFVKQYKPFVTKLQKLMLNKNDFELIKIIGRGAFGEVHLVRGKFDKQVYAMKILSKWEMLRRQETAMFKEERKILLNANEEWLTNLHYCFQDENFLYLVMEYYPGGDFLTLMSKFEEVMSEDMARFYAAELLMGIECIHKLGFAHRDIKPDNILIDKTGHIKLTDFGSCIVLDENGLITSNVSVGTPDYISPETLQAVEGKGSYGKESDWWSFGVVIYEMLMGETPFYSESLAGTYAAIMNHKQLNFPDDVELSNDVKDLIRRLLTDKGKRLGAKSVEEIKNHKWFTGINWNNLKNMTPPYIPEISDIADSSHFDDAGIEDMPEVLNTPEPKRNQIFSGNHLPFVGFSYSRHLPIVLDNDTSNDTSKPKPFNSIPSSRSLFFAEASEKDFQAEKEGLLKQIENLRNSNKEKESRLSELEIFKTTADRNLEELRARLEQERNSSYESTLLRKRAEETLHVKDSQIHELEAQVQEISNALKIREAEKKVLEDKVEEENRSRGDFDKNQKTLKTQVAELKESLEKEQLLRKKAETARNELQDQVNTLSTARDEKGKSELEQIIANKDLVIQNLKEALEKEYEENDEALEELENKLASDKKHYVAIIDELKLELEKIRAQNKTFELKAAEREGELTKLSRELTQVNETLFSTQKELVEMEEQFNSLNARLIELQKNHTEQSDLLTRTKDSATRLEENELILQTKLKETEAKLLESQATIRQLQSDLNTAQARLSHSEAAGEIEDLRTQLNSEKEIRKMIETNNTEANNELAKLRKRLEEAINQRQQIQNEKTELLASVEPLKAELDKEKKHRTAAEALTSRLQAEVTELTQEITQADQSFEEALAEIKDKCDKAIRDMTNEMAELESAKKNLELTLWKTRNEKEEAERLAQELRERVNGEGEENEEEGEEEEEEELPETVPLSSTSEHIELAKQYASLRENLKRSEERLVDRDQLISSLQARLESQADRINSDGKRIKTLMSEMDIIRTELERESSKRKALEKEKKKFNAEISKVLEDLSGMTIQRDELLENKISLSHELEELNETIKTMKEMHEHEIAAIKIQQNNSVKDLSIRVKEVSDANQRLRRRTAAVETLLSKNAGSEDTAKLIQDLEFALAQAQMFVEQEKQLNRELSAKINAEETRSLQLQRHIEKLESTVNGIDAQLKLETKANQKAMDDQRNLLDEIGSLKLRLAEASKYKSELEGKLRVREADFTQASFEIGELAATKKSLAEQVKTLQGELDQEHSNNVRLETTKKRMTKELEDLRAQLLLSADDQKAALIQQLQEKEAELTAARESTSQGLGDKYEAQLRQKKELEGQLEELKERLDQELGGRVKAENEVKGQQKLLQEVNGVLERKKVEEEELHQKLEKERNAKLDLEMEISRLRSENTEAIKKLDAVNHANLDLLVDIEEHKGKLARDGAEVQRLEAEVKQLSQDKLNLQERLAEVTAAANAAANAEVGAAPGLRSSASISRKPSMRTNWKDNRNEKKVMEDMRSLQQALDVTIKSKTTLEKINQELLVEKESLAAEVEALKATIEDLHQQLTENTPVPRSDRSGTIERQKRLSVRDPTELESRSPDGPTEHKLVPHTFTFPTKSRFSGKLLYGTFRQGYYCEVCGLSCLPEEKELIPSNCGKPRPTKPQTIEQGTGYLKVPKPKGIRQGWKRVYATEADGLLYVFSVEGEKSTTSIELIIDARSEFFEVSEVNQADVIHASRKEVECIFQIITSEQKADKRIFLADSPAEKAEWMKFLQHLHKNVSNFEVETQFEGVQRTGDKLKLPAGVTCVKRWISRDAKERFIVGAEDGVYIGKKGSFEKVLPVELTVQIDIIEKLGLIVTLGGKTRQIQVWPEGLLEGGPGWPITLDITKNCRGYSLGKLDDGIVMAVILERGLIFLQVDESKRFRKIKELSFSEPVSCVKFFKDQVCVGAGSRFRLFNLKKLADGAGVDLPAKAEPSLSWISGPLVASAVFKFKLEFLLCFNGVGVFVNESGKQSRPTEFRWLSTPIAFAVLNSRLLAFSHDYIEVFSLENGRRLESVSLSAIVALDAISNLICTQNRLYSLRYVGERDEEISDEGILVGEEPVAVSFESEKEPEAQWSRADSEFLKSAISSAQIDDSEDSDGGEESTSEEDSDDPPESAGSSTISTPSTPNNPPATPGAVDEEIKSKMDFLLNW